jgi:transcriptional regulator with XRE-family HTH domain
MQDLSEATLRLRKDQLWRHAKGYKVTTERELAEHLRISPTTVWRLLRGDIGPGERLIAAALVAFPDLRFEDLFEVAESRSKRRAA